MRSADSCPESEARSPKSARALWLGPVAGAGIPFAVYLITSARHVLDGDAAAFAAQAHNLGLVHPPGYAVMGLLGKLVTSVARFGPPAWRANLVGVVAGTAALAFAYALVRRWSRDLVRNAECGVRSEIGNRKSEIANPVAPAVLATWLLAFSPLFWSQSLYINPYTPALALTLGVLLLLDLWSRPGEPPAGWEPAGGLSGGRGSPRLLAAAGLLCGLGMNAHPSFVLGFPAIALYVLVRLRGEPWRQWGQSVAAGLAGLAAGCLVWLAYTFHYLEGSSVGELGARFATLMTAEGSGSDWRSFFRGIASPGYPAQLVLHATRTLAEFSPVGLALFALGAVAIARRRRWDILLLVGLMYLAQMNFAATLRHWHHYDVYRLPCFGLQALVMGVGLAWVWARLRGAGVRALALAGVAVLVLGPPYAAAALVREESGGPLRYIRPKAPWRAGFARNAHSDGLAVLAQVPAKSTIVSNYGAYATLRYLQKVEGAGHEGVWLVGGFGEEASELRRLCEAREPGERVYVYLQRAEARQRAWLAERFELRPVHDGALHLLYEAASRNHGLR